MNNLANVKNNQVFLTVANLKEKIADYARHAFAKNTIINYESDWKNFAIWCKLLNINPLSITHKTLTAYITTLAERRYKASTIQRKISGIVKYCETKNIHVDVQNKEFKIVWQGIRRKLGLAKQGKEPILLKDLEEILENIPQSTAGIRDKALLMFGWFSAMRRSEIVQLNWQDITFIKEGIIVNIRQSKTDKFGEGQKIAILKRPQLYQGRPCPIKHLKSWQELNCNEAVFCSVTKGSTAKGSTAKGSTAQGSRTKGGRITGIRLSGIDVARIVKKWALNFDVRKVAGHSLRRGFVTTAVNHGIRNHIIMKTTRHKSSKMIDDYTGDTSLIENNATGMMNTQQPATNSIGHIFSRVYNKIKQNLNLHKRMD